MRKRLLAVEYNKACFAAAYVLAGREREKASMGEYIFLAQWRKDMGNADQLHGWDVVMPAAGA